MTNTASPLSLNGPPTGSHIRGRVVYGIMFFAIGALGMAAYSALTKPKPPLPQFAMSRRPESQVPDFLNRDPPKPAEAPIVPVAPVVTPNVPAQPDLHKTEVKQPVQPKPPRQPTPAEIALDKAMRASPFRDDGRQQRQLEPPQVLEVKADEQKSPFALDGIVYPLTKYTLAAGDTLPCVMVKPINSELFGSAFCQITRDVYDSATHQYLLVPQGAKAQLKYDNQTVDSQNRLLVLADRIMLPPSRKYPYGSSVGLAGNPASDIEGYNGLHDKVDRHLFRAFGSALAYAAVAAGVGMANGGSGNGYYYDPYDPANAASRALGRELDRAANNALRRGENLRPTFTIRGGQEMTITLDKDLPFTEPFVPVGTQQISFEEEGGVEE